MVNETETTNLRKQGAVNLAFRGDGDERDEKIEMVEKFRRRGSKSVSFSESEEPKRRTTRLNPILPRQKKSLEEDPVMHQHENSFLNTKKVVRVNRFDTIPV